MSDKIKEMFELDIINAEPVYTLAKCITAVEQRKTPTIEDFEDCINHAEAIKERFQTCITLCGERELSFLQFAAGLTAKKAVWEKNVDYYPFRVFAHNDFVYLFLWENKYYLVLPDELMGIYYETIEDENFAEINARKLDLSKFAAALINLYGAYEVQHFVAVWNQHRKDKITPDEALTFLSDRAYFNSDFYFIGDYVVHDCLFEDDFDELWEATEELNYYMPTKSVIREYANKGHDDSKIPGEQEMDDFMAAYISDERKLENAQLDIKISCERLQSPSEVREILARSGAPLDDTDFCSKFERLYNTLRNNTHIWELRGFTPHQYQLETGESISRFKLPENKKRKK